MVVVGVADDVKFVVDVVLVLVVNVEVEVLTVVLVDKVVLLLIVLEIELDVNVELNVEEGNLKSKMRNSMGIQCCSSRNRGLKIDAQESTGICSAV